MHNIQLISPGNLEFAGKIYRCAIGKNGLSDAHIEGDKKTPIGSFALRQCFYRSDRIAAPQTCLKTSALQENDGWCDDVTAQEYNKYIKLPLTCSHEKLWREDNIYDIVVPLGYNDENIIKGNGSAIFFHIAKPDYSPTLGCVAVALPDMLEILGKITSDSLMITEI